MLTTAAFLLAAVPMFLVGLKVSLRPLGWQRMLIELPLYGPTLLWRGVANWSRLLGLLVKHGVPLPEATKLASEGIYSPVVAVDGMRVSKMVAGGRTMAEAMSSVRNLPASMVPLVRWGETHNSLPEALDSVADMFENRVQMRALLLQSILPPLALIWAAAAAMWIVNAMMMPLFKLITDLSGSGRRSTGFSGSSLRWEDIEGMTLNVVIAMAVAWLVLMLLVGFNHSPLGFLLGRLTGTTGRRARSGFRANVRMFLQYITWILTFVLLFVLMVLAAGIWGIVLWFATVIVVIAVRVRYWQMERRVLVWLLGVATEKQIPLPEAAQAFADERMDKLGVRAHRLAIALNQGLPLDKAIAATEIRLPNDALVAVRDRLRCRRLGTDAQKCGATCHGDRPSDSRRSWASCVFVDLYHFHVAGHGVYRNQDHAGLSENLRGFSSAVAVRDALHGPMDLFAFSFANHGVDFHRLVFSIGVCAAIYTCAVHGAIAMGPADCATAEFAAG